MSGRHTPEPKAEGPKGVLSKRKKIRVATPGSQRRCYNGCFPSSDWEMIWDDWEVLESSCKESRLEFWRSLGCGTQYKWEKAND